MPSTPAYYDTAGTALRGLLFLSLRDTGYVLRYTLADNLGGGGTATWGTAGTVWCRVDPLGGGDVQQADRIDDRTTHLITVPALTDVQGRDHFVISGITFEVTAVRNRTSPQLTVLEATKA